MRSLKIISGNEEVLAVLDLLEDYEVLSGDQGNEEVSGPGLSDDPDMMDTMDMMDTKDMMGNLGTGTMAMKEDAEVDTKVECLYRSLE